MTERTAPTCDGCRFWSELVAKSEGGGPVQALCLSPDGPFKGQYKVGSSTCDSWKSGHLGTID
jgi:hypothetical protein